MTSQKELGPKISAENGDNIFQECEAQITKMVSDSFQNGHVNAGLMKFKRKNSGNGRSVLTCWFAPIYFITSTLSK